jgi:hypothetical protein
MVVAEGDLNAILKNKKSFTGQMLKIT